MHRQVRSITIADTAIDLESDEAAHDQKAWHRSGRRMGAQLRIRAAMSCRSLQRPAFAPALVKTVGSSWQLC